MPRAHSGRMRRRQRCSWRATFTLRRGGIASTQTCSADSSSSRASPGEAGMQRTEVEALQTAHVWSRALRLATVAVILIGALARINVGRWAEPWSPHQPDEHILPLEALALWEGITPREVGWPGSTTRLVLSVVAASQCLRDQGRAMWAERAHPDRALQIVSTWIGNRYVDRRPLYRMGRTISVVTGILQLVAVVWALSQWVG